MVWKQFNEEEEIANGSSTDWKNVENKQLGVLKLDVNGVLKDPVTELSNLGKSVEEGFDAQYFYHRFRRSTLWEAVGFVYNSDGDCIMLEHNLNDNDFQVTEDNIIKIGLNLTLHDISL